MGKCENCGAEVPDEALKEKDGKKVCEKCAAPEPQEQQQPQQEQQPQEQGQQEQSQ